jgi:hypothetical protein
MYLERKGAVEISPYSPREVPLPESRNLILYLLEEVCNLNNAVVHVLTSSTRCVWIRN